MRPSAFWTLCLVAVLAVTTGGKVFAAMSSTNYEIRFDHLGSGGEDTSGSASYQLRDSIGGIPSDGGSSTSYEVNSGYRAGIFDPGADFTLFIEDRSSQVAATALAGETVTVTSAAGMAAGDMIAIVQDEGESQVSAIGEVTSIAGTDVTVDFLTDGGTAPVIDGTGDRVYVLDDTSLSLGALSTAVVTTGIIAWEVNSDVDDGYSVYVYDDGNISNGIDEIPDVADGAVSVGVPEYGGRSSDVTLAASTFDTADTGFTTSLAQVGTQGSTFKSRDFLTTKVSIDAAQQDGTYASTLIFVYVGDY